MLTFVSISHWGMLAIGNVPFWDLYNYKDNFPKGQRAQKYWPFNGVEFYWSNGFDEYDGSE